MATPSPAASGSASATLDSPGGHLVVDEDSGRSFVACEGQALLDAALAQGVDLPHGCRSGACGACAVDVVRGCEALAAPDPIEADTLERYGFPPERRLACRARTHGALRIRPLG